MNRFKTPITMIAHVKFDNCVATYNTRAHGTIMVLQLCGKYEHVTVDDLKIIGTTKTLTRVRKKKV